MDNFRTRNHTDQHSMPGSSSTVYSSGIHPLETTPPAALSDYCKTGGVDLHFELSAEQVAAILDESHVGIAKSRAKAQRALPAHERMRQSALALLHAHAATHGRRCALSLLRKGPIPGGERTAAMIKIYRALTGDATASDRWLAEKALTLHRRRTSGGDRPSPSMRRSFAALELAEKSIQCFHVAGTERLKLEHKEGRTLLSKNCDMNVRGLVIGGALIVPGPHPETGAMGWYGAKVRGIVFKCGLPPVLITYTSTDNGDTSPHLLPYPRDSSCFKHQIAHKSWRKIGSSKPSSGRELSSVALADALLEATHFNQADWNAIGVDDAHADDYIKTRSGQYFQLLGPPSAPSAPVVQVM